MQILKSIVALVLVGLALAAIWGLTRLLGFEQSVMWTALIAAIAWGANTAVDRKREQRRILADQKRDQYYKFLEFLGQYTAGAKLRGDPEIDDEGDGSSVDTPDSPNILDSDHVQELGNWSRRLMLIGSDRVLRIWNQVRSRDENDDPYEGLVLWGLLMLEMRKDCGHHDTALSVGDILGTFVNDIDEYSDKIKEVVAKNNDQAG